MLREEIIRIKAWRQLGLKDEEYERIVSLLGRDPTWTELGMFSVLWSEHCSYKHSRALLKQLPTEGEHVLVGPGENAGVVDVGTDTAIAFRIESHNHPVFVDPYEGAATGVGGMLRDIMSMGARPAALLGSVRFGPLEESRARWHFTEAVAGMSDYGNTVEVPTVGGEVFFAPTFSDNPLCNVMCLGFLPKERLTKGVATGKGNPIFLVGAPTGRDGIHGATFASADLAEETELTSMQVGDPAYAKRLIEACLELVASGDVVGIQDMGAAGITSSCAETAARAGSGVEIDVAQVPVREENMTPYEIMLSESQERMLVIARRGAEESIQRICRKWDVNCAQIGEVTDDGFLRVKEKGVVVAEVPARALTEDVPTYTPPAKEPAYLRKIRLWRQTDLPLPEDYHAVLTKLLDSPNIASKDWVYQQFDYEAQGNTVVGPGCDAAVLKVPETDKMIAVSVDGNSLHCYLDPYQGAAGSVAEAARNVVCVGGRPLGLTNGLNFGSPENPESYWQLSQAVEGIAAASRALGIPVTGGNVSLYNETGGESIYPTPIIGVVGVIEGESYCPMGWQQAGDVILLLGKTQEELGGSEYLSAVHGLVAGKLPQLDLDAERRLLTLLLAAHKENLIASAHDLSHGGLAIALVECCLSGGMGAQIDLPPDDIRLDALLFGETPSRVVVSCRPRLVDRVQELAAAHGVPCVTLGKVGEQELVICQGQREIIDMSLKRARDIYSQAISKRLQIG